MPTYSSTKPAAEPALPPVVKAVPLALLRGMPLRQGFIAIVANCLAQIRGNEAGVIHGTDPESVHQMRIGLRRLRSACALFKGCVEFPPALHEESRWLVAKLGAARDWEVLAGVTLAPAEADATADSGMAALRSAAEQLAQKKRARAAHAVASTRYANLMRELVGWMLALPRRKKLDAPLKRFADAALRRAHKRLRRRGRHLQDADPAARHRSRIAAKKTRYAAEFFASLYPARRTRAYIAALGALQDELGLLNDAALAEGLLQELEAGQPDLAGAVEYARGYLAATATHEESRLKKCWKHFDATRTPHRK